MTQECFDWCSENRIRPPLRGTSCNNYLNNNNNYPNNKMASGMGLKASALMKSLQRPKGIFFSFFVLKMRSSSSYFRKFFD